MHNMDMDSDEGKPSARIVAPHTTTATCTCTEGAPDADMRGGHGCDSMCVVWSPPSACGVSLRVAASLLLSSRLLSCRHVYVHVQVHVHAPVHSCSHRHGHTRTKHTHVHTHRRTHITCDSRNTRTAAQHSTRDRHNIRQRGATATQTRNNRTSAKKRVIRAMHHTRSHSASTQAVIAPLPLAVLSLLFSFLHLAPLLTCKRVCHAWLSAVQQPGQ